MPDKKRKTRVSLKKFEAVMIKISPTAETIAAAATLITSIIAIAQVMKIPLEVQKVVPLKVEKVTLEPVVP